MWQGIYEGYGTVFPDAVADTVRWEIDELSERATVAVYVWSTVDAKERKKWAIGSYQYLFVGGGIPETRDKDGRLVQGAVPDYREYFGKASTDPTYNLLWGVIGYILAQPEWQGWK